MWTKPPPYTYIHLSTYQHIQRCTEVEEPMNQHSFGFTEAAMITSEQNLISDFCVDRLVDSWIYTSQWDLLKLPVLLSISGIKSSLWNIQEN